MWKKEALDKISHLESSVRDAQDRYNREVRGREDDKRNFDFEMKKKDQEHDLTIQRLESEQTIALVEKQQEIEHYKDDELKKARLAVIAAEKEVAVFKKENEMLTKITDLNGDVIDIKELVGNLIKKLPEINVSTLNFTGTQPALPSGTK